jgi:hypothetical protein
MTEGFSGQGGGLPSWKHVVDRPPFTFYPATADRRYGYDDLFLLCADRRIRTPGGVGVKRWPTRLGSPPG